VELGVELSFSPKLMGDLLRSSGADIHDFDKVSRRCREGDCGNRCIRSIGDGRLIMDFSRARQSIGLPQAPHVRHGGLKRSG
jgi:hypothetical protein